MRILFNMNHLALRFSDSILLFFGRNETATYQKYPIPFRYGVCIASLLILMLVVTLPTSGQCIRAFSVQSLESSGTCSSVNSHFGSGLSDRGNPLRKVDTGNQAKHDDIGYRSPLVLTFSSDGRYILIGSSDGIIRLWDPTQSEILQYFEGHTDWVRSLAFSQDNRYIVSGADDTTVRLWNTETGEELRSYEGHTDWIYSVAFSPDGSQIVSGSLDSSVRLWNTSTGDEIHMIEEEESAINSVAFSPDGELIAYGSGHFTDYGKSSIVVWNTTTGDEVLRYERHDDWVRSIAFSPDGMHIASGSDDNTIQLWDITTGTELHRFEGHTDWILSVAYSPNGDKIASGSGDTTVRVWDTETGEEIRIFEGHTGWVRSVAFSPDGRYIASGADDSFILVWELESVVNIPHTGSPPTSFLLNQNYPNPFNLSTTIHFDLPEPAHVRLVVMNALGRHVTTLLNQWEVAGHHEQQFHADGLPNGVYFYQLHTPANTITQRMQLLK